MDLDQAYQAYSQEPSAQHLRPVVDALRPTIDYSLNSIGSGDDPHMRNMAKVYTAKAIEKYDPSYGAGLKTWVSRQLQQLGRLRRQTNQVLKVPERIQIDSMHLENARQEFFDRHDRDPDTGELSETSKMPISRIAKIREYNARVGTNSPDFNEPAHSKSDFSDEAMDYIYQESDHLGRKILEHRLGYGGADILPGKDLTRQLGLTDSQLSRKAAQLSKRLLDVESQLESVA